MSTTIPIRCGWSLIIPTVVTPYLLDAHGARAALHCLHNQPLTLRLLAARLRHVHRRQEIAVKLGDRDQVKSFNAVQAALVQVVDMLSDASMEGLGAVVTVLRTEAAS